MKYPSKFSGLISIRGHHFYADLINDSSTVIDLGANMGQFSHQINQLFGCRCYAVEAIPYLYDKIVQTSLVKVLNYAITSSDQTVKFYIDKNPEFNHIAKLSDINETKTLIEVDGISLESLVKKYSIECIDLIKMDIEGSEIDVFSTLSDELLTKVKQVTVEFHDFMFDIAEEVDLIESRMKKLGFIEIVFSKNNRGDVLFINKSKCAIPKWRYFYIQHIARYTRGALRIINRVISRNTNE